MIKPLTFVAWCSVIFPQVTPKNDASDRSSPPVSSIFIYLGLYKIRICFGYSLWKPHQDIVGMQVFTIAIIYKNF